MAEWIRFPYANAVFAAETQHPTRKRPVLKVTISSAASKRATVYALLDTGADFCGFPLSLGRNLGVVRDGDTPNGCVSGAGNDRIPVFHRTVTLQVHGVGEYQAEVGFSEGFQMKTGISGVLGQCGFFDRFRVEFNLPCSMFRVCVSG